MCNQIITLEQLNVFKHVNVMQRTGHYGYNLHRLTIEDWTKVAWSDAPSFLLGHQIVWSEFGISNMDSWIHPVLYQRFSLLAV